MGACYAFIIDHLQESEIMMANAPKPRPSRPKGTGFVVRPYRRIPIQRVLYYLGGKCVGKGIVTNLSQSGMRVQGEHEVEPGFEFALRLTLSDDGPMIDIEQATVRWVDGNDFGLDFVRLSPLAKKHITDALIQQIRVPQSPA
ncbi:MAG: PilZ domain-containing protein [Nitrospirota bacterium]